MTGNYYTNRQITFKDSLEKPWTPCSHTVLGTRITNSRIWKRINKTVWVKISEIKDHVQKQEIVDVEEKVIREVNQGINTTHVRPVTVVASVEGVEKIFTRNQSNAMLWSQNVTDARRFDIGQACADRELTSEITTMMFRLQLKTQEEASQMLFREVTRSKKTTSSHKVMSKS